MTRFTLDGSVRRVRPTTLLGGSPLRLFQLTDAGARMVDRIAAGEPIAENSLLNRLVDAGVLHPVADAEKWSTEDVTIVVPAYAAAGTTVTVPDFGGVPVIVVDDASPGTVCAPASATVIRRTANGGPSAARATGLESVTSPFVAFVDSDVVVHDGWLDGLLPHLADSKVAAVAPRVRCVAGTAVLARYEGLRSPLDLGGQAARVRARTRVSYVPSAALVARTRAVRDVGGFDDALRTGEDVDLVWRLDEAGWRVRYEPSVVVEHESRRSLGAFVAQRRGYGRSAAPLSSRHPGALAPVGVSGWSAAVWTAIALGQPLAAALVGGGTAVALTQKLPQLPRREAARLVGLGHFGAGRQLASAITRVWWPILVPLSMVSRRARRVLLASVLLPALSEWNGHRKADSAPLDPIRFVALRTLDDAAYGVGVWEGVWRERTLAPLVPDLTSWPASGRYDRGRHQPAG
jgi:mycofactocin glycosyltransferase